MDKIKMDKIKTDNKFVGLPWPEVKVMKIILNIVLEYLYLKSKKVVLVDYDPVGQIYRVLVKHYGDM